MKKVRYQIYFSKNSTPTENDWYRNSFYSENLKTARKYCKGYKIFHPNYTFKIIKETLKEELVSLEPEFQPIENCWTVYNDGQTSLSRSTPCLKYKTKEEAQAWIDSYRFYDSKYTKYTYEIKEV